MLIRPKQVSLGYRDIGSGVPVIFIHAFPLNQTMWDDQVTALQNQCRAITLDLRGFGESEAPQGPHSMDQMAGDVRDLMSALGIDRAILVGLSMGGYVSLAFYRRYPKSVMALVLADTRASADTPEAREQRLQSAAKAEKEGAQAIAGDMIPLLLGPTTLASRPSIVARVRTMIEANSPVGIAGAQRGMAERLDSTSLLRGVEFPVLVIVGSEDTLIPVTEAENLSIGIPDARLRIIERAGHLSNLERPDEFNAALTEFIKGV